jgi:hypothetical protein
MQKVVGSSPIIRSNKAPAQGLFSFSDRDDRRRQPPEKVRKGESESLRSAVLREVAPTQAEPSKATTSTGVIPQPGPALRFLFRSLERLPACLLAFYEKRVEHLALLVSMS